MPSKIIACLLFASASAVMAQTMPTSVADHSENMQAAECLAKSLEKVKEEELQAREALARERTEDAAQAWQRAHDCLLLRVKEFARHAKTAPPVR